MTYLLLYFVCAADTRFVCDS